MGIINIIQNKIEIICEILSNLLFNLLLLIYQKLLITKSDYQINSNLTMVNTDQVTPLSTIKKESEIKHKINRVVTVTYKTYQDRRGCDWQTWIVMKITETHTQLNDDRIISSHESSKYKRIKYVETKDFECMNCYKIINESQIKLTFTRIHRDNNIQNADVQCECCFEHEQTKCALCDAFPKDKLKLYPYSKDSDPFHRYYCIDHLLSQIKKDNSTV